MAASRALVLNAFNQKFEEFLGDLVNVFPEDTDFRMFKNSFNLVKNIDDRKVMTLFIQHSPMYRDHILAKNDAFFLGTDFGEIYKKDMNENNITLELINKLKNLWRELNEENRKFVWKYFTLFLALQDKYVADASSTR